MKIISLFLFFAGWTIAFELHPWLPVPMVIGITIFAISFFYATKKRILPGIDKKLSILFFLFFLSLIVSFLLHSFYYGFNTKVVNHTLSFFSSIFIYFFGVYWIISYSNYPLKKLFKYLSWGVVFVAVLTIIEFSLRNFLDLDINYLRITERNDATYEIGGQRFFRARGTTVESGHLAMYLIVFLPFVFHYQYNIVKSKFKMLMSVSLVLLAVFFTFSAAGIVEVSVTIFVLMLIKLIRSFKSGFKLSSLVLFIPIFTVIVFTSIYFIYTNKYLFLFRGVLEKVTLVNYSINDGGSRLARWYRTIELFKERPLLGHGAGISSIRFGAGSTSLYLELLAQGGLLGFAIFVLIIYYHLIIIIRLKGDLRYVYLISFITLSIHLAIIANYWYPWMWLLFAMINIQYYRQKYQVVDGKV